MQKVSSALKLSGFVNVTETKFLKSGNELDACFKEGLHKLGWSLTEEQLETIALVQVSLCVCMCACVCVCALFIMCAQIQASKPGYEIGASSQLSLPQASHQGICDTGLEHQY